LVDGHKNIADSTFPRKISDIYKCTIDIRQDLICFADAGVIPCLLN